MNSDIKHIVSKSETCLVESFNSVLRYYLVRLQRRTQCYSKALQMLEFSIVLFILFSKYGWIRFPPFTIALNALMSCMGVTAIA